MVDRRLTPVSVVDGSRCRWLAGAVNPFSPYCTHHLPVHSGQVHLWFAFVSEIVDETLLSGYRRLLSETERQQERRFVFPQDRHRYLVTRALVRSVLTFYAPIQPVDWIFSSNRYGRPSIANEHPGVKDLSFNVSHTNDVVVLAIAQGRKVGVDIENAGTRHIRADIAERFFAREEFDAICQLPQLRRHERLVEYWTLKEAYAKARGLGLSIPLNRCTFRFLNATRIEMAIADGSQQDGWSVWQLRVAAEYVVAVCAENMPKGVDTFFIAKKVVPMLGYEDCPYTLLRSSH